jgi:hypothetical protein
MNKRWIGATLAVLPLAIGGGLVIAYSQNTSAENPMEASREAGYPPSHWRRTALPELLPAE